MQPDTSIIYLPDILSADECRALIDLAEALGFESARINGALQGPQGFKAVAGRNNDRAAIDDPTIAGLIETRVSDWLPEWMTQRRVSVNARLRIYRYDPGQSFPSHTDGFHSDGAGWRSTHTLLLYLNGDFKGGETYFSESKQSYTAETGAALIFAHELWHEGRPLLRGRKYVVRTDVMFGSESTSPPERS